MEISLTFFNRFHTPLENNVQYEIRREVSRVLHHYNFGDSVEIENDKFVNTFLVPTQDRYYEIENDLFISFTIDDLRIENQGNLAGFLIEGIPQLQFWIRTRYLNVLLIPRVTYL